jgi:alpha-ketoglutarate-dependent taurine dioxygenase
MKSMDDVPAVVPTDGGLGAEIRGVDLRRLGDDAFAAIHRAWLDNLVLLFRGQEITDAELIAFSRRFGELDLAPIQEIWVRCMMRLAAGSNGSRRCMVQRLSQRTTVAMFTRSMYITRYIRHRTIMI